MNFPNDVTQNYLFCRLQIVIEMFEHWTLWTNQSKFNKIPKNVFCCKSSFATDKKISCWNLKEENMIVIKDEKKNYEEMRLDTS